MREPKQGAQQSEEAYDEVIPYKFMQYNNRKLKQFPSFDVAVDTYPFLLVIHISFEVN